MFFSKSTRTSPRKCSSFVFMSGTPPCGWKRSGTYLCIRNHWCNTSMGTIWLCDGVSDIVAGHLSTRLMYG